MPRASAVPAVPSTQQSLAIRSASRAERVAGLAAGVERRVAAIRRVLVNSAPKGHASLVAEAMGWRVERRSRELSGVEKLSLAEVIAEIELHLIDGRQDVVDEIVGAMLEGIRSSSIPVTPGSVFRVFDKNGQLFLRLGE